MPKPIIGIVRSKNLIVLISTLAIILMMFTQASYGADNSPGKSEPVTIAAKPSTIEVIASLPWPINPGMILGNIKVAMANHLLLRDDFYTDENVRHLLGAGSVKWVENSVTKKYAYASDYGTMFKTTQPLGLGRRDEPSFFLSFQKTEDGKIKSRLDIDNFGTAHLNPTDVEKFFGRMLQCEQLVSSHAPSICEYKFKDQKEEEPFIGFYRSYESDQIDRALFDDETK